MYYKNRLLLGMLQNRANPKKNQSTTDVYCTCTFMMSWCFRTSLCFTYYDELWKIILSCQRKFWTTFRRLVLVPWHNGTLQNGHVTKQYVLQNGTCYKTVRVTKQYALQNGTCYKTVTLQNGTCYTTVCYKTVTVTERYVTKRYTLQNGTFFILRYEGTNPWISWAFALT
jgi:hypothetical protein